MTIQAVTAEALRQEVLKVVTPVFDSAGKLLVNIAKKIEMIITDALNHHHHVCPKTFFGVDIVIDEIATDVCAYCIKLTVLWSPNNKMNDIEFENSGKNTQAARDGAMKCIETVAKYHYFKK